MRVLTLSKPACGGACSVATAGATARLREGSPSGDKADTSVRESNRWQSEYDGAFEFLVMYWGENL
jgi:hypothetical protein